MIRKNSSLGQMNTHVKKLGWVPACLADAFSWLPHAYGQIGRGKNKKIVWEWVVYGEDAPSLPEWNDRRCSECIFQEPEWSQKYPMCAFSWCHDVERERLRRFRQHFIAEAAGEREGYQLDMFLDSNLR